MKEATFEKITRNENYIKKSKALDDFVKAQQEKELEVICNNLSLETLKVIRAFEIVIAAKRHCESLPCGDCTDEDLKRWSRVFDPVFEALEVEFRWCIENAENHDFIFVDDTHEKLLDELVEEIDNVEKG